MLSNNSLERLLAFAALTLCIELVLFKFLPDLSTALLQGNKSALTGFSEYQAAFLTPGSVHHSRFLGNYILYLLARAIDHLSHSADVRLHPLRVAAGLLTPIYAYLGAWPVLRDPLGYSWRAFVVPYALAIFIGLYTFYPCDVPSLAFLSLCLHCVLREKLGCALIFLLVTGLFRESSFHGVAFAALWAVTCHRRPVIVRFAWVGAFAGAFVAEYLLVRRYFPGPLSASGGVILDPWYIFLGSGMWSLTTICSLSLAALFPIAYLVRASAVPDTDWRRRFFLLNCYLFPGWIVCYRMLSGNISEFRLLLPALLPCIYGLAYEARPTRCTAVAHP